MAKKSTKKGAKKATKKSRKLSGAKKAVKKAGKKIVAKKAAKRPAKKVARKAASHAQQPRTTTISPYLAFNGNCEEAFNFYRSVFGGEFGYVGRFKDMPAGPDGQKVSDADAEKIMHISLPISREAVLMGSDTSEQFGHVTEGNNFSISISTVSDDEADRIYHGLAEGGKSTMPMSQTFWDSYFGMLTDKFGISWMVSHEKGQQNK